MTQDPFTSFVMFAEMRTGSNFLEANLNALEGVTCLGEMFNPHFIGRKNCLEAFGMDMEARARHPRRLLRKLRAETPGLTGFRYFRDHQPEVLADLLSDPLCAKIILTRNPLESYVSLKIAQATGQWKLTNLKNHKTTKIRFDGPEFERHAAEIQAFQLQLKRALQESGQTAFYIDYDDLQEVSVLNGLAAWLGVPSRLGAVDQSLKRQNPGPLADKVENPEAIALTIARLDPFNLTRGPGSEPRRAPMIPSFLAAADAPLLYLPVRGGPVRQVSDWLAGLGQGGLTGDFVQKTLRAWKSAHPGHRSFTVIRHPLLRAHQVFLDQILTGRQSEIRQLISRSYEGDLPPLGHGFVDKAQHHQGFLAFLRYARHAASGQNGSRIDGHFASQSAVLQGFSTFQPPDLVLRETGLATGLAFLAEEAGIPAPPFTPDPAPAAMLDAIWSPALEAAANEAWPHDYNGFGFAPWRTGAPAD